MKQRVRVLGALVLALGLATLTLGLWWTKSRGRSFMLVTGQVYELTRRLFAGRAWLAHRLHVLARISERFESSSSPFPLHPGAEAYFRRNDPPFVSRYANELSLELTVGALVWSGFSGLNAWRQRRHKGRVEEYFAELHALHTALETADTTESLDALERETLERSLAERRARVSRT